MTNSGVTISSVSPSGCARAPRTSVLIVLLGPGRFSTTIVDILRSDSICPRAVGPECRCSDGGRNDDLIVRAVRFDVAWTDQTTQIAATSVNAKNPEPAARMGLFVFGKAGQVSILNRSRATAQAISRQRTVLPTARESSAGPRSRFIGYQTQHEPHAVFDTECPGVLLPRPTESPATCAGRAATCMHLALYPPLAIVDRFRKRGLGAGARSYGNLFGGLRRILIAGSADTGPPRLWREQGPIMARRSLSSIYVKPRLSSVAGWPANGRCR